MLPIVLRSALELCSKFGIRFFFTSHTHTFFFFYSLRGIKRCVEELREGPFFSLSFSLFLLPSNVPANFIVTVLEYSTDIRPFRRFGYAPSRIPPIKAVKNYYYYYFRARCAVSQSTLFLSPQVEQNDQTSFGSTMVVAPIEVVIVVVGRKNRQHAIVALTTHCAGTFWDWWRWW